MTTHTTHALRPLEPLSVVVERAARVRPPRRDWISEAFIASAAVLATAGFVVAAAVDRILAPRRRRRRYGS